MGQGEWAAGLSSHPSHSHTSVRHAPGGGGKEVGCTLLSAVGKVAEEMAAGGMAAAAFLQHLECYIQHQVPGSLYLLDLKEVSVVRQPAPYYQHMQGDNSLTCLPTGLLVVIAPLFPASPLTTLLSPRLSCPSFHTRLLPLLSTVVRLPTFTPPLWPLATPGVVAGPTSSLLGLWRLRVLPGSALLWRLSI